MLTTPPLSALEKYNRLLSHLVDKINLHQLTTAPSNAQLDSLCGPIDTVLVNEAYQQLMEAPYCFPPAAEHAIFNNPYHLTNLVKIGLATLNIPWPAPVKACLVELEQDYQQRISFEKTVNQLMTQQAWEAAAVLHNLLYLCQQIQRYDKAYTGHSKRLANTLLPAMLIFLFNRPIYREGIADLAFIEGMTYKFKQSIQSPAFAQSFYVKYPILAQRYNLLFKPSYKTSTYSAVQALRQFWQKIYQTITTLWLRFTVNQQSTPLNGNVVPEPNRLSSSEAELTPWSASADYPSMIINSEPISKNSIAPHKKKSAVALCRSITSPQDNLNNPLTTSNKKVDFSESMSDTSLAQNTQFESKSCFRSLYYQFKCEDPNEKSKKLQPIKSIKKIINNK
jgi:hypothetical protein